jgi:hypothetical protein
MTLAEVQKGYRDDVDGDASLSQRQQRQQAPQLSQERQLLQAAAMIHTALILVSGVSRMCPYVEHLMCPTNWWRVPIVFSVL